MADSKKIWMQLYRSNRVLCERGANGTHDWSLTRIEWQLQIVRAWTWLVYNVMRLFAFTNCARAEFQSNASTPIPEWLPRISWSRWSTVSGWSASVGQDGRPWVAAVHQLIQMVDREWLKCISWSRWSTVSGCRASVDPDGRPWVAEVHQLVKMVDPEARALLCVYPVLTAEATLGLRVSNHDTEACRHQPVHLCKAHSEQKLVDIPSSLILCSFSKGVSILRTDLIIRSQTPPMCEALGGLKCHAISRCNRNSWIAWLFQAFCDRRSFRSAPTKLVPLSHQISRGFLLRMMKRWRAFMNESVSSPLVISRCTARTVRQVKMWKQHEMSGHTGREHVLSLVRQRYWIIAGRSAVRNVLGKCFTCKRNHARPATQRMADLPSCRLMSDHPPFTFVGMDLFGRC